MTQAELSQIEAAKEALPKATPGPWLAGRPDMATLVDGIESKWIYAGDQYLAVASGRIDGEWEEVIANSKVLAATPVLTRRVIELEAEVQRLKEWQERAVEGLVAYKKFVGSDRLEKLSRLITEAQGGGDGSH